VNALRQRNSSWWRTIGRRKTKRRIPFYCWPKLFLLRVPDWIYGRQIRRRLVRCEEESEQWFWGRIFRIRRILDSSYCGAAGWVCSSTTHEDSYGVAAISRLLQIIDLFCRIQTLLYGSFAKESYNFKEPTNRSHPITRIVRIHVEIPSMQTLKRTHGKRQYTLRRTHGKRQYILWMCIRWYLKKDTLTTIHQYTLRQYTLGMCTLRMWPDPRTPTSAMPFTNEPWHTHEWVVSRR